MKEWLELLKQEGPKWGYFPEPKKSYLIVKAGKEEEARQLFPEVNVVGSHRYLGGVIGPSEARADYVRDKAAKWVDHVEALAECGASSPQATYTAFVKSLQQEWAYLQRVVPGCAEEFEPLRDKIRSRLTPAILGWSPSPTEHQLLALPVKLGGLAIEDPVEAAEGRYETSRRGASVLVESITAGTDFQTESHIARVMEEQVAERAARNQRASDRSREVLETLAPTTRHTLKRIIEGNASQWLSVVPLATYGLDLSPAQFQDALCLRYSKPLPSLGASCDGCGATMNAMHALNCKTGGLVKQGHDQIRDVLAGMSRQAYRGVVVEPVMREGTEAEPGLVADIRIQGVWERERASFYDLRVVNADAASYSSRPWESVAEEAARAKHRKYDAAAEDLRASFVPLITSCEGVLHKEFQVFLKRLIESLADKWTKPRSAVASFVRTKLQMATIRAVSLRLRGSRKTLRSAAREDAQLVREEEAVRLEDGAPLPLAD